MQAGAARARSVDLEMGVLNSYDIFRKGLFMLRRPLRWL